MKEWPRNPRPPDSPGFPCPNCGHAFPPGTRDPCRCPDCDALCSSTKSIHPVEVDLEEGVPPPLPPTPEERRRYRIIFWIVFISTPLAVLLVSGL